MSYTIEGNAGRGDQILADCLVQYLDRRSWTRSDRVDHQIRHVSGGRAPIERHTKRHWGEANNLQHMALVLRSIAGPDQANARAVLLHMLRDQRDHGQAPELRLCHRGQIEDMSIGYASYHGIASHAAMAAAERGDLPREIGEESRQHRRRDLAIYAMHTTPSGLIHVACGRVYGDHGEEEIGDEGAINVGLEWELSRALWNRDGPRTPGNPENLWRWRFYYLAQVARNRATEVHSLFSPAERDALTAWIRARRVTPALRALLDDVRLDERLRIVAWQGGHLSYWPTMHTYGRGQPVVLSEGERMSALLSRGAAVKTVVDGDRISITNSTGPDRMGIPASRPGEVEVRFYRDTPPFISGEPGPVEPADPVDPPPPPDPDTDGELADEVLAAFVSGAEAHIRAWHRTGDRAHLHHAANKLRAVENL